MITQEQIEGYQKLYKETYDTEISREKADIELRALVNLLTVVHEHMWESQKNSLN